MIQMNFLNEMKDMPFFRWSDDYFVLCFTQPKGIATKPDSRPCREETNKTIVKTVVW